MATSEPASGKGRKDTGGIAVLGVQLLNVGAVAALIGFSVDWWMRIPEQVPIHWTLGSPDRWAGSTWWTWFSLPAIGASMTVAFLAARGLKGLAGRHPWLISLPLRKTFVKLSEPARNRILHAAFNRLGLFPLPINLFLLYGQWVNYEVAMGRPALLHWTAMGALFLGAVLVLTLYFISLTSMIGAEARKAGVS